MNRGKRQMLYITTNDGSDMRINKEVKSLSKDFSIIFIGVGNYSKCYVKDYCFKIVLFGGKRNTILVLLKQILTILKIMVVHNIQRIHIINEPFLFILYPICFFKYTVVDLFDSIFLRKNYEGNKLKLIKYIVYLPANKIIVTDKNRYELMPDILQKKCVILPNYPELIIYDKKKKESEYLRILYNGWMGQNRGTEIVEGLIKTNLPIKIYMAGWFADNYTKEMVSKFPRQIEYMGIIPQKEALELANNNADYILCTYAPINQNNINASPNKIYDAILTNTPIIINSEVKVSKFILEKKIGYILPLYDISDFHYLYNELYKKRNTFSFDQDLKKQYIWQNIECNLFEAHKN